MEAAYGGKHPAYGTHNALLSLGNGAYLEIIAPDPNRKHAAMPTIFGLDKTTNMDRLVAFAVHPNPSMKGATFELIAQSMYLSGYKIGGIKSGERQSPDGQLLQWRFTSPLCAKWTQPFVIHRGNTRSPAETAPTGCRILKLVFYCQEGEVAAATEMYQRIGLISNGGRVPVAIEKSDGSNYMAAEILTPKGRRVFLGQRETKVKEK